MIDLHLHSNYSDGSDTPSQLVGLAAAAGLSAMALTDHDTLRGLNEANIAAQKLGIELVPGVELSCKLFGHTTHILGYFINPKDETFAKRLLGQRDARADRNERLVVSLQNLGYDITLDEVLALASDESVGKPHFAGLLMAKGYVSSVEEAFNTLLASGKPADVSRESLSAQDGIKWIREAGGLAVWAHPFRTTGVTMQNIAVSLDSLQDAGLTGVESWYSKFDQDTRVTLAELVTKRGLVATGGSDYHGEYKPDLEVGIGLGDLVVPNSVLEELRSHL